MVNKILCCKLPSFSSTPWVTCVCGMFPWRSPHRYMALLWPVLCLNQALPQSFNLSRLILHKDTQPIQIRVPPWFSGSVLDHRSLPPVFESWRGHIWRLFHLWLRFITFGGRSAHLAYHVHKNGCKTPIIIIHQSKSHKSQNNFIVWWLDTCKKSKSHAQVQATNTGRLKKSDGVFCWLK